MGHTNTTPNYNLPQFVGSDKPTFLGDINGAFLAIDSAIAGVAADADSATSTANTAASTAAGAVETANSAASTAASAASTATSAASTANTAADTANNAQSTAVLAKSTADTAAANATTAMTDAAEAKAAAIRGNISYTSVSGDTWADVFGDIFTRMDKSKVTPNAILEIGAQHYPLNYDDGNDFTFGGVQAIGASYMTIIEVILASTLHYYTATVAATNTFNEGINDAVTAGTTITLYY